MRARSLSLRKHRFSIIGSFPMVRARFLSDAKTRFSKMLLFPLVRARFLSLRKHRFSRIGSFPMVRTRFWRPGSAKLSKKCIFQVGKWPWRIRWEVGPAGCGRLVGGLGGEVIERLYRKNRTERRFVTPCVRNHLLLALEGGAGSRTPAAWVPAPPKRR